MSLILEDGSVIDGANSYATENMADDYFDARANTAWAESSDDKEAALIRATAAIDATYRGRFPGYRVAGREQSLEWPRAGAYDTEGLLIDGESVPDEVIEATYEAAYRELVTPGALMPDVASAGPYKRLKAGSVEVEYAANAAAQTTFSLIDGLLSGILTGGSGGGLFGVAVRG